MQEDPAVTLVERNNFAASSSVQKTIRHKEMIQFFSGFRLLRRIGNGYSWGICAEVVYFRCSSYQVPCGVYEYLKKDVCACIVLKLR